MSDDDLKGSPLRIPARDLRALAALLEAIVPGRVTDAPAGWSEGWQGCCVAIRAVADNQEEEK